MYPNQRNALPLILMSISLLLLLLFLCFWLKNVYQKEYEVLQTETDYVFSKSAKVIKDEILKELLGAPVLFEDEAGQDSAFIKIKLDTSHGLTKFFSRKELISDHHRIDSVKRIAIATGTSVDDSLDFDGTVSLSMVIAKDTFLYDTDHAIPGFIDSTSVIAMLKEHFTRELEGTSLPKGYQVMNLKDPKNSAGMFKSEAYTDLLSGERYAAFLEEYQPYLWRQMIPEFLFSLFLFSCIAASFWVIYRNFQRQRRLTQLKNDFVSNVTHELKTPITTVAVAIEALSDFNVLKNPEQTKEYLNISRHELNRLSILVDKVLKMSLFEKKEPELKLESLDINALVQDILDTMKLQFEKNEAEVRFNPLPGDEHIEGDRVHLTSVVYNLIDNALKYSPGKPEIRIDLEKEGSHIILKLADKGMGIAKEFKDKIFEKFFRIPTGNRHDIKGYGLGLSYVASVVEKHKGSIEVESQPDEGTCFTISLPKKYAES